MQNANCTELQLPQAALVGDEQVVERGQREHTNRGKVPAARTCMKASNISHCPGLRIKCSSVYYQIQY